MFRRRGIGRRRSVESLRLGLVLLAITFIFLTIYLLFSLFGGAERKALQVVERFYAYEQGGNYGQSWELLHSEMQARFDRASYVQDRAHVFNGHFGAETFAFEVVGGAEELRNWKLVKDGEPLGTVYQFVVEQEYHGKYGHFLFVQYVYVGQENDEWRILWDYKE
ncbi:hypothetical protein [Bacillus sp. THAF10]|uniref:hypothetical protein n=1 Tax=Bacillus sp. THAF10 TaxID=2587848 RepID=UPI001267B756|nr:hypothetical protein [Bacillus sp. THAF10]